MLLNLKVFLSRYNNRGDPKNCRGLLALLLIAVLSPAVAQSSMDILLKGNNLSIPVTQFQGEDKQRPLFLWLVSKLNSANTSAPNWVSQQHKTASKLESMGYAVWLVDAPLNGESESEKVEGGTDTKLVSSADIAELIQAAADNSKREVVLLVGQSMANTALEASRYYQLSRQAQKLPSQLAGMVLFSPVAYAANELPGEEVDYADIVYSSNIPTYIIQADKSSSRWRANELVEVLRSGGAKVFLHRLAKVQEGFYWRSDQSLSEADFNAHEELPFTLGRAARLLAQTPKPLQPVPMNVSSKASEKSSRGLKALDPYPAQLQLPVLPVSKRDSNPNPNPILGSSPQWHDITQYHGKVVLLSFWASWCLPCLQELPALRRLYDDYHSSGLDVVTVNAGEDALAIQAAADKHQMNEYTLLMDLDGTAVKNWNVYGYPSNFLVNRSGQVVYGSIGPIRWDDPAVRAVLESLLKERI